MAHDFLASWHEEAAPQPVAEALPGPRAGRATIKEVEKHRTVGVSLSPKLRAAAAARARVLGLPFSRYVAWCVEAELEGRPPQARFARRAGKVKSKRQR